MNKYYFALFLTASFVLNLGDATADPGTDMFIAGALQGDLSDAMELFSESNIDPARHSDQELSNRFTARFTDFSEDFSPATGDALADAVVVAYRTYWVKVLTRQLTPEQGEAFLQKTLRELFPTSPITTPTSRQQDVFNQMSAALQQRGFHVLDTPAPPLLDLFLWRGEETKPYKVRLTDRTQAVRVTFISEIYSLGWKEFATLGLISTTGWVEGNRLYCISAAYDRNSENFRVSYLKHESRHLADFRRFPGLSSADLEYRAKLTELAFASGSLRTLLDDFTAKSAQNPESPHAHANFLVTRDMYEALYGVPLPDTPAAWASIDTKTVNKTARLLLGQNTRAMESRFE